MTLPTLAGFVQLLIGPLLAALLVTSFLQVDVQLKSLFTSRLAQNAGLLLSMQLVLPLCVLAVLLLLGVPNQWLVPICLVAAASCITGGPSIVMMLGGDGAQAIRLLITSTLALPLTSFPIFALLPLNFSPGLLLRTSVMLTVVVLGSYFAARLLRRVWLGESQPMQRQSIDGVAALLLALIVVGLMSAIHTAWDKPKLLLLTLLLACVVNFGFQLIGLILNRLFSAKTPIMLGVLTGNRAVAIFLTALPAAVYQPYLLFIACYQIPMYLTPLLGSFYYRKFKDHAS